MWLSDWISLKYSTLHDNFSLSLKFSFNLSKKEFFPIDFSTQQKNSKTVSSYFLLFPFNLSFSCEKFVNSRKFPLQERIFIIKLRERVKFARKLEKSACVYYITREIVEIYILVSIENSDRSRERRKFLITFSHWHRTHSSVCYTFVRIYFIKSKDWRNKIIKEKLILFF